MAISTKPLRYLFAFTALFASLGNAAFAQNERPRGNNCDLTAPHELAGETMSQGVTLRVYPRALDIDASYNGCQVVWAPEKNGWATISVTLIEQGDPILIWHPDKIEGEYLACEYRKGQVVKGNPDKCPIAGFLILRSVAPGCVERSLAINAIAYGCKFE